MRAAIAAFAALLSAACAAPEQAPVQGKASVPGAGAVITLRNPSFEADSRADSPCATGWSCTMHADPKSFRFFSEETGKEGRRSFCMEPLTKEPWGLLTQGTREAPLRGARLRFSIAVRATAVSGRGAGPWVQVRVSGMPALQTHSKLVQKAESWEVHAVEFEVPSNAITVEVGAMLHGRGRACFDDARLEVLRPAKNPL
ncbi:MAG TPA: hypothetical protein VM073_00450 [Usitatibacter sp.]|nr:hypothetical protein [Usitatibacter sp.]